ncbi:MAG: cell division protein FtsJ [Chloroflexia bacterium]|nr:cell division protein FtsJ [Chloroflexia bacterium]
MSGTRLFFSAAEDYLVPATEELRERFPDARFGAVGPDLGWIDAEGLAIGALAEACLDPPTIFIRHLMREVGSIPADRAANLDDVVAIAIGTWSQLPLKSDVSLQVWSTGEVRTGFRTDELRRALAEALTERGITVARSGQEQILGAVVAPEGIILGLNGHGSALSDWPGGQVRLSKPKGQISRSEFKLEELFRVHDFDVPERGIAIDLGASPGGWTRILRQRGLTVWAVDPATLDPRIASDPKVHHVRMTAGPFLNMTDVVADLVVNDMRMDPDLSASVMLDAAKRLKPGGTTIQTLKVTPHNTLRTVRRVLESLQRDYDIVWAGQLHHNRNEVTVVGRKRP